MMQGSRSVLAVALIGVLMAACGGSSPTQAPAAATQNPGGGGGATQDPGSGGGTATQDPGSGGGGGGGAGDTSHGKVHIEISGPVTKSSDYGFIPAASLFGGDQGSSLSFSNGVQEEIVSILISADGSVVVSWGTRDFTAPAAECTTSNWNVGATSASGSFDCTAALVIMASGASVQNGKVKGSFEARA